MTSNNNGCSRNTPVCCNCPPRKCGKGKNDDITTRIQKSLAEEFCSRRNNDKLKLKSGQVCVVRCDRNDRPKPVDREAQVKNKIIQESRTGRRPVEHKSDNNQGARKNNCDRRKDIEKQLCELDDRRLRMNDEMECQKHTLLEELNRLSPGQHETQTFATLPPRRRAHQSSVNECGCGCGNEQPETPRMSSGSAAYGNQIPRTQSKIYSAVLKSNITQDLNGYRRGRPSTSNNNYCDCHLCNNR